MAKAAIIRVDRQFTLPVFYVRSAGRDGDFALTAHKAMARRFTLERAAEKVRSFANTRMQFSVCDAPGATDA
jgi:hypothetical protein